MTLLVAWTGIDSRAPASVYIATDSRVSWKNPNSYYDNSIKTFTLNHFPAIIGYCGDSITSLMIIAQATAIIDAMPDPKSISFSDITELIRRLIERNYETYPKEKTTGSFTIVITGKDRLESSDNFKCCKIHSDSNKTTHTVITFPESSGVLIAAGTGKKEFEQNLEKRSQEENPNQGTSREISHAFYQTICDTKDPAVGAIPQITTVQRKPHSAGLNCGVIVNNKRYICGQIIDRDILPESFFTSTQWFNGHMEITNPNSKAMAAGAQPQPPYLSS